MKKFYFLYVLLVLISCESNSEKEVDKQHLKTLQDHNTNLQKQNSYFLKDLKSRKPFITSNILITEYDNFLKLNNQVNSVLESLSSKVTSENFDEITKNFSSLKDSIKATLKGDTSILSGFLSYNPKWEMAKKSPNLYKEEFKMTLLEIKNKILQLPFRERNLYIPFNKVHPIIITDKKTYSKGETIDIRFGLMGTDTTKTPMVVLGDYDRNENFEFEWKNTPDTIFLNKMNKVYKTSFNTQGKKTIKGVYFYPHKFWFDFPMQREIIIE